MVAPKTMAVALVALIVLTVIILLIYTGVSGTSGLSWQTKFFFITLITIVGATSGYVGFRAGRITF